MRSALILTMLLSVACARRHAAPGRPGAGMLSVTWTGTQRGSFSAPAAARWCAADTLLEVTAVRGDTSFGFVLIARDSVRAETYVLNESQLFTPGRPQANVGLRLLGESTLLGFDAKGGQLVVTKGGRSVSGTIDVRMRRASSTDSLKLKGSFERLEVTPASFVCGRANKPGGG